MRSLVSDLRIALRSLARRPAFTTAALLTVAVGVGLNTAIFSLVYGVLLRSLPYSDPDRVVALLEEVQGEGLNAVSPPNYLDWRERNRSFSAVGAFSTGRGNLTGPTEATEPERLTVASVTADVLPALAVPAALGRTLAAGDDVAGAPPVVVLGHELWQRRFGGDEAIVGRSIDLDGVARTVVGVMPPWFRFPIEGADVWTPLVFAPTVQTQRGAHWLRVVGRLRQGVSLEAARADMSRIAAQLAVEYPRHNAKAGVDVTLLHERATGYLRKGFLLLWGAVGLVILVACVNLANLTLAAGAGRVRAIAIRSALGAARARLARQLLTESAALGGLGGLVALPLSWGATQLLVAFLPSDLPRLGDVQLDLPVLAFGLGLALLTGLAFGLLPALHGSRVDLQSAFRSEQGASAGRARLRSFLVVGEIALAVLLACGAGLMIKSLLALTRVEPGFVARQVLTFEITLPETTYAEPEQQAAFYEQLEREVQGIPEVEAAGAIYGLPMSGFDFWSSFVVEGDAEEREDARVRVADSGYFETLRIPVLEGRGLTAQDRSGAPRVLLASESAVRRYFQDSSPVGRRLKFGARPSRKVSFEGEIVGVVGDVRSDGLASDAPPLFYVPLAQAAVHTVDVVVRTSGDPLRITSGLRAVLFRLDGRVPMGNLRPLEQVVALSIGDSRLYGLLLGVFAAVALLLAAIGIYGVTAYTVAWRKREIGIRSALGATRAGILRLLLRGTAIQAAAGLAIGLAATLALTRLLRGLLHGVDPLDPWVLAAAVALLAATALGAALMPARRATRVDPALVLRDE